MLPTLVGVTGIKRERNAPDPGGGLPGKSAKIVPGNGGVKRGKDSENSPNPGGGKIQNEC